MDVEKNKSNLKINLSNIYTEKELEQIKKLIPKLSSLIITPNAKKVKISNILPQKITKMNQFIDKEKFVKIILEQILNIFKDEENEILSKSINYLLNDNISTSKEKINKRNSIDTTKLTKNHFLANLAEKQKIKGDDIFKQIKTPRKPPIDIINKTEIHKKFTKSNFIKLDVNNISNIMKTKRKKKIKINGDFDGDKTDYNIQNIKKISIVYNSNTFNATANPGIISSKINTTEFPNFGYSYYPRKSTISDKLCDSKSINKIKKAYFLNQHNSRNYRNQHNEKRVLSPFDFRTYNKITERSLEDKKGKKDKKRLCRNKNNKININIDNNSNENIRIFENLKTEIKNEKEKINPINSPILNKLAESKNINSNSNNNIGNNNINVSIKNMDKKAILKDKNMNLKTNSDKKEIININLIYNEIIESKDFDIFEFEKQVGKENTLSLIGSFIFKKFDFSKIIKYKKFGNWSKKLTEGYLRSNPYHNDLHAADVTQTCFLYILQKGVQEISRVDNIDICILTLSCMCHDFKHPGVNNNFLKLTKDKLAIRYNDINILENMHISQTFKLINKYPECDIFSCVDNTLYEKMRKKMILCVLSTDMVNHINHINFMKNYIQNKQNFDIKNGDNQDFMNILIHSADISNPTKPFNIYLKWSKLVLEEFLLQGDKEKALGLTCTYDRNTVKLNTNQLGFIDFVVKEFVSLSVKVFPSWNFLYDNMMMNREKFVNYKEDNEKENVNDENK